MKFASAIIVAAGKGSRMQSDIPKQFLTLDGRTVLFHTMSQFLKADGVSEIILVIAPEYLDSQWINKSLPASAGKPVRIVAGGTTRQQSVQNGLAAIDHKSEIVLTHDGVRLLIQPDTINAAIEKCMAHDGVIVAIPATDTLKKVAGTQILETIDRKTVWQMQTPQVFKREVLEQAFLYADKQGFAGTDEASLVEQISADLQVLPGRKSNIKITVKEDLAIAKAIMENYAN
ncbi:MAG: 2-C-methyl-D-erythritol 4-phosphate cytidylyltransferase [Fidelibacterota bacterium]